MLSGEIQALNEQSENTAGCFLFYIVPPLEMEFCSFKTGFILIDDLPRIHKASAEWHKRDAHNNMILQRQRLSVADTGFPRRFVRGRFASASS